MRQYIVIDDRYKVGKTLLALAKLMMPNSKSIKIINIKNAAISPSLGVPYNIETQQALRDKKTYKAKSVKELFESV